VPCHNLVLTDFSLMWLLAIGLQLAGLSWVKPRNQQLGYDARRWYVNGAGLSRASLVFFSCLCRASWIGVSYV
jgi:hypothetical protein